MAARETETSYQTELPECAVMSNAAGAKSPTGLFSRVSPPRLWYGSPGTGGQEGAAMAARVTSSPDLRRHKDDEFPL